MTLRIRSARERVGLSQKALANRLGINAATLSGYESGSHDPRPETLAHIARICGVSADYLLNLDGQAEMLVANAVRDGGGLKTLFDNLGFILEKMMPEDAEKRAALVDVLDNMLGDFESATRDPSGEYTNRIGNEIMIDS